MRVNISAEDKDWIELWGILGKVATHEDFSKQDKDNAYLWVSRIMEGVSDV